LKVVDLNILLYAINRDVPHHPAARQWVEEALSGEEPIAFPWVVVLGFLRLTTNPRIFLRPLTSDQALSVMEEWLTRPSVRVLEPGEDHWRVLRALLEEAGTAGNLTTDAHLAAIAIEHGAELVSTDTDFARFPRLHWTDPLRE
jgi:toxin-antitoxin system PIN domain toxin